MRRSLLFGIGSFSVPSALDPACAPCYPRIVLRRVEHWMIVSLLVLAIGAHWALLQSAAWAGMFISYSRTATVGQAFSKTFDGEHPCKLCKLVKRGQQRENKQRSLKPESKLEFSVAAAITWLYPPARLSKPAIDDILFFGRSEAPHLPPPRIG